MGNLVWATARRDLTPEASRQETLTKVDARSIMEPPAGEAGMGKGNPMKISLGGVAQCPGKGPGILGGAEVLKVKTTCQKKRRESCAFDFMDWF